MRRLLLLVLCCCAASAQAQDAPKNLLKNGSADTAEHWGNTGGTLFSHDPKQGKGSLSITKATASKSPDNWNQAVVPPAEGKPYNLELVVRMKTKGLAAGSAANVMVQILDAKSKMLGGAWCTAVTKDSDWTTSNAVFRVPRTCVRIRVLAYFVGKGQVWFDDLTLVVTKKPPTGPAAASSADSELRPLVRGAASDIPWTCDARVAKARAKRLGKPILLYVRCTDDHANFASAFESIRADKLRWGDDGYMKDLMFRAGPLSDPDLAALISRRFVPLCLTYLLSSHARGMNDPRVGPDRLELLRLSARNYVTPALTVLTAEGKPLRKLHRQGILSAPLIDRWLRGALADLKAKSAAKTAEDLYLDGQLDAAKFTGVLLARAHLRTGDLDAAERVLEPLKTPEAALVRGIARMRRGDWSGAEAPLLAAGKLEGARFHLGWCLARQGKHDEARTAWKAIVGKTRFGRKAAACLLSAGWRLMMAEVARDITVGSKPWPEQTEYGRPRKLDAARSLRALIEMQRRDGSFGGHHGLMGRGFSDAAITAIAGDALWLWRDKAPKELRPLMAATHKRALAFLDAWSKRRSRGGGDSFNHAYVLMHLVRVGEKETARRVIERIARSQSPDGNWTVYQVARPASFNTALCIIALARAKKAGLVVPEKRLARGVKALAAMRQKNGHFPYSTMRGHEWMTTDHAAIARNPLCETALIVNGEDTRKQLATAFGFFLTHHAELRTPTKKFYDYFNRRGHGGYYFFFAHRNAWEASEHLPAALKNKVRDAVRAAVLSASEFDGTFMDSWSIGRAYGTSMALCILAE